MVYKYLYKYYHWAALPVLSHVVCKNSHPFWNVSLESDQDMHNKYDDTEFQSSFGMTNSLF